MNWHQHLRSPVVLAWAWRTERSDVSCMRMICCFCLLMKRVFTTVSPSWRSSAQTGHCPLTCRSPRSWSSVKNLVWLIKKDTLLFLFSILDHVTSYNYLGLTITASGHFSQALKDLTAKARRAFYCIKRNLFKFNPPIKLWLKIFDTIVKPVLLYGCELWGPTFKLNYESWEKKSSWNLSSWVLQKHPRSSQKHT